MLVMDILFCLIHILLVTAVPVTVESGNISRSLILRLDIKIPSMETLREEQAGFRKGYASHIHKPDDQAVLVYCVEMSEVVTSSEWHSPKSSDVDAFKVILEHEVKKVQNKLEEFGDLLKRLKKNGIVKSTQSSKPGEGILRVAKDMDASLIVTGSRGLGKIRRTILGSVSDYLVHHAHVPVLVCRFKEKK